MQVTDLPSGMDAHRVLLIGDIDKAFADADALANLPCKICTDMADAIQAAAKGHFRIIAVVLSAPQSKLKPLLEALRRNSDAKVILLARMHEEPAALQLVRRGCGANLDFTQNKQNKTLKTLADDYLICPLRTAEFFQAVTSAPSRRLAEIAIPPQPDPAQKAKIKRLEQLATTDELAGLKNRRYTWEFCRQVINRAKNSNGQVTLLVFDIDNFKNYNDLHGHSAGDEILRQAGILMRRCCRGHDVIGRIGGDEFAVVFWDNRRRSEIDSENERRSAIADHPKEPIFIANRFRAELENAELHLLGPGGKGVLTISGGLATFPHDGSSIDELFKQADKALLDAKRSGKNRIYLVGRPQNDIANIE